MTDPNSLIQLVGLPLMIGGLFYIMIWRPQQKRMKDHAATITAPIGISTIP